MNEPIYAENRVVWSPELVDVKKLLRAASLPDDDLGHIDLHHFAAIYLKDEIVGLAGAEQYARQCLIRSVVTNSQVRGRGVASGLLRVLEQRMVERGVSEAYLLTETARTFFTNHGYAEIERIEAPAAIRATAQFADLCPADAYLMKKDLA